MTTEDELRKLLNARAVATTWTLTVDDVVNNDIIAEAIPLERRRKRTPMILGAVATVGALLGAGAYVVAQRGEADRVNVGTAKRSTTTDSSSVAAGGRPSAANTSLADIRCFCRRVFPRTSACRTPLSWRLAQRLTRLRATSATRLHCRERTPMR